jgi:CheY-like chemotaxis protein
MKVLICEDNEVALKVMQVALEDLKLETVVARDGRRAIQLLDIHTDFDLIITDIHMPYQNGDEILNEVRSSQGKSTPIIMVSSDADKDVISLALQSGVNEFIEKPLDPKVLKQKVKKLLKLN